MSNFLNPDNAFFRGVSKAIDSLIISFIWSVMNFPTMAVIWLVVEGKLVIVSPLILLTTILSGPSTCALYYSALKTIRNGRGYMLKEYFRSFKENFKIGVVVGEIYNIILSVLAADIYLMNMFAESSEEGLQKFCAGGQWVFIVFFALALMWGTYLFSYIARFSNTTKNTIRNTLIITMANLPKSIMQLILLLIPLAFEVFFIFFLADGTGFGIAFAGLCLLPGPYALIKSVILEKTFRKYMSEEDIQKEEERNREYLN